ncbi:uncharacterized protein LOC126865608 isoform X2 [Bombus huntii]|uniref:uncharacterized protein LOC126865608 isoform X2 n=1 Tax=Bombus huntii TaxID=85661 RepID=UPI0021A9BE94|nr:uncharacterized protein LOC126865608 isoform X2 [Bombus huntii]
MDPEERDFAGTVRQDFGPSKKLKQNIHLGKMINFLSLLVLTLTCVIVHAQQTSDQKPVFGQTFDEIVVSSDLNVRRKSKESRQGKRLTNIPSGTTGPPEKSTVLASRFISNDGSQITWEKTQTKREISNLQKRYLDMGITGFLLNSRKR